MVTIVHAGMKVFSFLRGLFFASATPIATEAIFFGLGNPGKQYACTRHTIGFRIADALAQRLVNPVKGNRDDADYLCGMLFDSKKILIVKPQTFMNRSGSAVAKYVEVCRCPLEHLLVIVDDYNLPLGRIRARRGGSDGGHNGLKSIIAGIGENFPRLRIGIGPLPAGVSTIDFVLGEFSDAEEEKLKTVISQAVDACMFFAEMGIDEIMNAFN